MLFHNYIDLAVKDCVNYKPCLNSLQSALVDFIPLNFLNRLLIQSMLYVLTFNTHIST